MIKSSIYRIKHPSLVPYVQYVLFNKATESFSKATSFSNANICLGVLNNSFMYESEDGSLRNKARSGISSYISGMYLKPHEFVSDASLDEICIDFTPSGYYHFFPFEAKQYIIGEDILKEAFGKVGKLTFEQIFSEPSTVNRGQMVEEFLLHQLKESKRAFLSQSISLMSNDYQKPIKSILDQIGCSERKLQRTLQSAFEITPKQFLRINRFRTALNTIQNTQRTESLTTIAYQLGFNDQSHLVKEMRKFTGHSPKKLMKSIHNIDDHVMVAI